MPAPIDPRTSLTGELLLLLAGLAALGALAANIILPACPDIGTELRACPISQVVGALQIARALGDGTQGRRHLATARTFLLEQFDTQRPHGR